MGEKRLLVGGLGTALEHLRRDHLVAGGLALFGRGLVAVDQDHIDPGTRSHIRNPGTHKTRAEDADFP